VIVPLALWLGGAWLFRRDGDLGALGIWMHRRSDPLEHLMPPYPEWQVRAGRVFGRVYRDDVVLSVVQSGFLAKWWAVGVRRTAAGYEVFRLLPEVYPGAALYAEELRAGTESGSAEELERAAKMPRPEDIPMTETAAPISPAMAALLVSVWRDEVASRAMPPPVVPDGELRLPRHPTAFSFSVPVGNGWQMAGALSPGTRGTRPRRMILLATWLHEYLDADEATRARLAVDIERTARALQ
jgi:hypothetical protein